MSVCLLAAGLAAGTAAAAEGGAAPPAASAPAPSADIDLSDWPQSRRDARNTAATVIDARRSPLPRAWSFEGSGRVWGYEPGITTWTSPALALVAGRAVLAAGSYDRTLYILDASTGDPIWKLTTGGPVLGTPAIVLDGERSLLLATSSDRLVYALDAASGRLLWSKATFDYAPTLGGARLASPAVGRVVGRRAVFVAAWSWDASLARNSQRASLLAFATGDGRLLWRRDLGDNQLTDPIFAETDGRRWLLVGSSSGVLYAIDADSGDLVWRRAELDAIRSQPAVLVRPEGALVVMASKYGAVRGLDLCNGRERWSFKTGERITGAPTIVEVANRPVAVVGSYDRTLYALDAATGAIRWRYGARGGIYSSPGVALLPGRPLVLVQAWDNLMHAVGLEDGTSRFQTFTGRPLWAVGGLDDSTWSSPSVARINGRFMAFVGSYDGTLRAIPLDEEGRQAWPVRSNLWFWLSFPLALVPFGLLAVLLSRLHGAHQRRRRTSNHSTSTRTGPAE